MDTPRSPSIRDSSRRTEQFSNPGWLVFRRPLLNVSDFFDCSSDQFEKRQTMESTSTLWVRARSLLSNPVVRESVRVASPELFAIIDGNSVLPERVKASALRYLARMSTRSTPFGLFASTGLAHTYDNKGVEVDSLKDLRRTVRLDCGVIFAAIEGLTTDVETRRHLCFRWNESSVQIGDRLQYIAVRNQGGHRQYLLESVEVFDELTAVWTTTRDACVSYGALKETLLEAGTEDSDCDAFLGELIDTGLLRADIEPRVTGGDALQQVLVRIREIGTSCAKNWLDLLTEVSNSLSTLNSSAPGTSSSSYEHIDAMLKSQDLKVPPKYRIQVDCWSEHRPGSLSSETIDALKSCAILTASLFGELESPNLRVFREAFRERYEQERVALLEVLDPEIGIGFPPEHAEHPPSAEMDGEVSKLLIEIVQQSAAGGYQPIAIDEQVSTRLLDRLQPRLPASFSIHAMCSTSCKTDGSEERQAIVFRGATGPSGANLLGRFCYLNESLNVAVKQYLDDEARSLDDSILAEIVHLPQGRSGNILWRPKLREHEMPYLAFSAALPEKQHALRDLSVGLEQGVLVLRNSESAKIVPRLTSAHNLWSEANLPAYRFLGELQGQGTMVRVGWNWGPLQAAPRLPRVTYKSVVLSRARWILSAAQLPKKPRESHSTHHDWTDFRNTLCLPRFVCVAEADNELTIDLETQEGQAALRDYADKRPFLICYETSFESLPKSSHQALINWEALVPFQATANSLQNVPTHTKTHRLENSRQARVFGPGSEWSYFKLYSGRAFQDRIIRDLIYPFMRRLSDEEPSIEWFFLRYSDPHHHLRVRFHGEPSVLNRHVVPTFLNGIQTWTSTGVIWKVQIDTYARETTRYGGPEGISCAERLFHADSTFVATYLSTSTESDEKENRVIPAICSIAGLFEVFSHLDQDTAIDSYLASLGEFTGSARKASATRYRQLRIQVETRLKQTSAAGPISSSTDSLARALHIRRNAVINTVQTLVDLSRDDRLHVPLDQLLGSFVHMSLNRLMRSNSRRQERDLLELVRLLRRSMRFQRVEASRDVGERIE